MINVFIRRASTESAEAAFPLALLKRDLGEAA